MDQKFQKDEIARVDTSSADKSDIMTVLLDGSTVKINKYVPESDAYRVTVVTCSRPVFIGDDYSIPARYLREI